MVKFEHTLFALPFAFIGALLARKGLPGGWQFFREHAHDPQFITIANHEHVLRIKAKDENPGT